MPDTKLYLHSLKQKCARTKKVFLNQNVWISNNCGWQIRDYSCGRLRDIHQEPSDQNIMRCKQSVSQKKNQVKSKLFKAQIEVKKSFPKFWLKVLPQTSSLVTNVWNCFDEFGHSNDKSAQKTFEECTGDSKFFWKLNLTL